MMSSIPPWLSLPTGCYRGARVLVLGGSGFIGYNLTLALAALGADVTAVSRGVTQQRQPYPTGVRFRSIDIQEIHPLFDVVAGQEVIFDVAGRSGAVESNLSPLNDLRVNVVGQFNVLEACRRCAPDARLIFASSRLVYGRPQYVPVDERHATDPTSIYGIHRLAAEKYHILYHSIYGLPITILRITVPYGPHQPIDTTSHGVVNLFMRTAVESRAITLYGDGSQLRDILHIDDLVSAMLKVGLSTEAAGAVLNVGGGSGVSLAELGATIVDVAGSGSVEFTQWPEDAAAVETGGFCADITRIRALTGWEPRIALRDGLASSIEHYRARLREAVPR